MEKKPSDTATLAACIDRIAKNIQSVAPFFEAQAGDSSDGLRALQASVAEIEKAAEDLRGKR
jgi:uncharacterized protein Yka (UPF0111/DUF47 family)